MKRLAILLALAVAAGAAGDDKEKKADDKKAEANKADLKAMQGNWAGDSMVRDGLPVPPDDIQALFRAVNGETYTIHRYRKKAGSGKFTLDATKTPKEIDLVPDSPPKGKAVPAIKGIYKIEKGKFTMCYGAPGAKRPEKFESAEESGVTLVVWVREKKE